MEQLDNPPLDAIKKAQLFGVEITYYAEYSDGCTFMEYSNGGKSWEGKEHSPHHTFFPDDIPVKEWGTRR